MGNANQSGGSWNQSVGWGGLPDTSREPYFVGDKQRDDWKELLCCPSAMGCTVVRFDIGEAQYKVFLRLSQNAHVPRYQLQVVAQGKTKEWVIGHMYKTETHLRTKPGEFIRVQVWNLTSNGMEWVERRNSLHRRGGLLGSAVQQRPTPKASDMKMMGMAITTQAKLEPQKQNAGEKGRQRVRYDKETERWVQSIAVDDPNYRLTIDKVEKPKGEKGDEDEEQRLHSRLEGMSVLRIRHKKKIVCVAKKQRFAGTPGNVCQPFLGVQIAPTGNAPPEPPDGDLPDLTSFLDSSGLMLLLLCLAWSEETMSPVVDASQKFINAMRANPGDPGSAEDLKLSEQWNTDDVKQRLRHVPYAVFHNWMGGGDDLEDDDDAENLDEADVQANGFDRPTPPLGGVGPSKPF